MIKPDMSANPAFDATGDPAAFFRKLWGAMPSSLPWIPGMLIPTLSIEEIDRQIAELKAVEGWLDTNRHMLRSDDPSAESAKRDNRGAACNERHISHCTDFCRRRDKQLQAIDT